ncbi:hypothetical protein PoB_007484400 [Plakobranchus ocellatus]|uniref:Uncharacterized protein n=1 Tax=Plakobranchus ocellatus TaxID=259542 RepID=A0AAV4DVW4_9GAST|nr:hypothetical protein PoB_007484400 [Plakobranchus ocellatus]
MQGKVTQGKKSQSKARQGKAKQGEANQGKTWHSKARRRIRRTNANIANDATKSPQVEGHVKYLTPSGEPDHQSPDANDVTVIGTSNGSQLNSNSRSGGASLELHDLTPQEISPEPHYLTLQEASTNHYDALQRSERDSEALNVYREGFDHYDRPIEAKGGRRPNDALPLVPTVHPPGSGDTPGYVQLLDERGNPIPVVDASDALPLVPTVCPPGSGNIPGYVQLLDERGNSTPVVDASDALPLAPTVHPPGLEDTPGYVQLLDEQKNPTPLVDDRGYTIVGCSAREHSF